MLRGNRGSESRLVPPYDPQGLHSFHFQSAIGMVQSSLVSVSAFGGSKRQKPLTGSGRVLYTIVRHRFSAYTITLSRETTRDTNKANDKAKAGGSHFRLGAEGLFASQNHEVRATKQNPKQNVGVRIRSTQCHTGQTQRQQQTTKGTGTGTCENARVRHPWSLTQTKLRDGS